MLRNKVGHEEIGFNLDKLNLAETQTFPSGAPSIFPFRRGLAPRYRQDESLPPGTDVVAYVSDDFRVGAHWICGVAVDVHDGHKSPFLRKPVHPMFVN